MHILLKCMKMQKLTVTFLNSKWLNMNKEIAYSYIKYTKITGLINVGKFLFKIKLKWENQTKKTALWIKEEDEELLSIQTNSSKIV